jgi:hypothetical protein
MKWQMKLLQPAVREAIMIDPFKWLETASRRRPKLPHTTEWFSGLTKPTRPGWYERHFADSPVIGDASMHWWDGKKWYAHPRNVLPHWRQVGDYPAWRGLNAPAKQNKEGANG